MGRHNPREVRNRVLSSTVTESMRPGTPQISSHLQPFFRRLGRRGTDVAGGFDVVRDGKRRLSMESTMTGRSSPDK
jgi:hypothetical protein